MRFVQLEAHNPGLFTGQGNHTYLIPGRSPVLIDAGVGDPRHIADIKAALSADRASRGSHLQVVVTHAHSDHASGAAALKLQFDAVGFAKLPWPEVDGTLGVDWTALRDGSKIAVADDELLIVHTPGHAPDHICLFHEASRTLFSGDLLVQGSTVVIPASRGGNLREYLASLRRVLMLAPRVAHPAHGRTVDDPETLIRDYLVHRQRREDQILAAIASGCATLEEIVGRVYRGVIPDVLLPAARETVLAHLVKLKEDGRVADGESQWSLL